MEGENRTFLYVSVLTGCVLGLISGLPLSWSSPVIPILQNATNENPLAQAINTTESSWIISLLFLGAIFGPYLTAITNKLIGMKYSLIGIGIAFLVSFLVLALAENVILYFTARFLSGMALGSVYSVLPSYITDISPVDIRGAMCSIINIFICLGLIIPYCVGPYTSIMALNLICVCFCIIFITAFIFAPESPVHLITKDKQSQAKEILKKLRGCNDVQKEFDLLVETEEKNKKANFADLFKMKSNLKALAMALSLVSLQQLSGIKILTVNTQSIFEETGSSIPSDISSIIVGAVPILPSFIAPLFIEKLGRRILLLISAFLMFISELPLGVYFYLKDDGYNVTDLYWLPLFCLVVFMVAYNIGLGPVAWTVTAEVFPPNVAHIGCAIASCVSWILSFLLTHFYSDLTDWIGIGSSFWSFSAFNLIAIVFVLFYLPETKGKTTLEIQNMLN